MKATRWWWSRSHGTWPPCTAQPSLSWSRPRSSPRQTRARAGRTASCWACWRMRWTRAAPGAASTSPTSTTSPSPCSAPRSCAPRPPTRSPRRCRPSARTRASYGTVPWRAPSWPPTRTSSCCPASWALWSSCPSWGSGTRAAGSPSAPRSRSSRAAARTARARASGGAAPTRMATLPTTWRRSRCCWWTARPPPRCWATTRPTPSCAAPSRCCGRSCPTSSTSPTP
mmetsp:Transcript_34815/g.88219  ORF Transcript_34815/g.88219 Transcript_34815/m.88219 type:complete len:227 (-) Transcript_34815:1561-2241(-)